jgi:hypothetical protein
MIGFTDEKIMLINIAHCRNKCNSPSLGLGTPLN